MRAPGVCPERLLLIAFSPDGSMLVSALLKRFWTDHRLASVLSLSFLFLGLLIKPWTLVLVLAVAFGGPLLQRLESFSTFPLAGWRRSNWIVFSLLTAAILLALTGKSGGQGALILSMLPVAWVLANDRGLVQRGKEEECPNLEKPLILSRPSDEDGSSEPAESNVQNQIATREAPEPLVGGDLLGKIKELGDVGKSDLVRACGYSSKKLDGSERLNFTAFYEALLEAKGIEASSNASDHEDVEEPTVDYDALWSYFKEGGGDIWNEDQTVYLGTFEGDPGEYIIEVNGPNEYGVPYCTGREDLPRIVEEFIDNGGSTSDLLKALGHSIENVTKLDLPEDWNQLEDAAVVERLKTSCDVSAEILRFYSGSDDWEVRQAVAWHDNTPADVIEALAQDDDSDVTEATLQRCLPQAWRYMSQNEKVEALKSDQVTLDIIKHLASSKRWKVRQAVAWSPSTPDSILEQLKHDDDDDVKAAATAERQLPLDWRFQSSWERVERLGQETVDPVILDMLARSRDSDVRRAVALHSDTPEPLLNLLREDDDEGVQSGLRERNLPDSWKSLDEEERISALKTDDVSERILHILARSNSWSIRQAVALSPRTPQEILDRLSVDDDTDVQSAVRERGLPENWKALDEDEKVEQLNEGPAEENVLEILAKSGRWLIRQAVAQNAGATEELLKNLLKDDDDDVKRAARNSLRRLGVSSTSDDDDEEVEDDEEHSIYIKTEPGGSIRFGSLRADQIENLQACISAQELTTELREIGDNSYGQLNECEGVVNSGEEGDFGNEGTIVYSTDQPFLGPAFNDDGSYKDGVYVVMMRLSKCSISFEFIASGGFDEDEFEEISVPVRLPEEIIHGLYGHPDFNIITGFRFRGETVEEYEGEVEDRGYDDQLTFFAIKDGVTSILYSNYNGDEEWCSDEEAKMAISSFY